MKNGKNPDPNVIHPVAGYDKEIYVKPTITNLSDRQMISKNNITVCKSKCQFEIVNYRI